MLPDSAAAGLVPRLKAEAAELHGRKLQVFAGAHIVCAATDRQARSEYDRMVGELGDRRAAETALRLLTPDAAGVAADSRAADAAIAGFFALPLVGSPDTVVARMAELAAAGLDGLALSWLDYDAGIEQYASELRPRLVAAGLREG
jgi:alkanesulfonate monooxygenase SsuD/methylene tetrahydromethanopterin reductase-like flavin-dependent oxidoreductase (luciferase family)